MLSSGSVLLQRWLMAFAWVWWHLFGVRSQLLCGWVLAESRSMKSFQLWLFFIFRHETDLELGFWFRMLELLSLYHCCIIHIHLLHGFAGDRQLHFRRCWWQWLKPSMFQVHLLLLISYPFPCLMFGVNNDIWIDVNNMVLRPLHGCWSWFELFHVNEFWLECKTAASMAGPPLQKCFSHPLVVFFSFFAHFAPEFLFDKH